MTLLLAAVLEAGGDALIRRGIGSASPLRPLFFALGALALFAYGYAVNAARWEFGKLLGVYVVFFFLVAQIIAWLAFHEVPSHALWIGGALIVAGGLVITLG
jgi:drug/metabolite transporter (DMT)-like permease